jgi:hypothetical protein
LKCSFQFAITKPEKKRLLLVYQALTLLDLFSYKKGNYCLYKLKYQIGVNGLALVASIYISAIGKRIVINPNMTGCLEPKMEMPSS